MTKQTFTLVELLVVIAIIAILAAFLMPVLAKARNMALVAQCGNNIKQTATASLMYTDDYGGTLCEINLNGGTWEPDNYWMTHLSPYLTGGQRLNSTAGWRTIGAYQCPVQLAKLRGMGINPAYTYAMSYQLGRNQTATTRWRKITQLPRPSQTLQFTEAGFNSATAVVVLDNFWTEKSAYAPRSYDTGGYYTGGVHDKMNKIAWLDGHASNWFDIASITKPPYSPGQAQDKWKPGL